MSLWGCNCPLPALAACHQRGMVCSQLVLFCPLFCEQAWQCLRAFLVVAILQSGLLAQVSSLRLPLGHSGPVLTLSHAACASLPSPHLLMVCAGVCAASSLGELPQGSQSVGFNCLFIFPPCYVALCASKAPHRFGSEKVSWCLETSLFLRLPCRDRTPSLPLLSLFLSFIFFPTSFRRLGLLFWLPDVLCRHSEVVLWNLLSV